MKIIYLLLSGILLFTIPGCQYFKSTHPQAEIPAKSGTTGMTDKSILSFSAQIDRQLINYRKEFSLIYKSGDLSMYVEKYSAHHNGMLYKFYTSSGNLSNTVKSYYLKNDSLILVKEKVKFANQEDGIYKDSRTYLRNGIIFKMDSRSASSQEALRTLPYLLTSAPDSKYPEENYMEDLKGMNDAILGKDKFEMVFDNITTYPDAHYIMLRSKLKSNYKASILVKSRDSFIDSLLNYPAAFKDGKLKLHWLIEDQDAVYVPVADTSTSARGLNK